MPRLPKERRTIQVTLSPTMTLKTLAKVRAKLVEEAEVRTINMDVKYEVEFFDTSLYCSFTGSDAWTASAQAYESLRRNRPFYNKVESMREYRGA